MATIKRNCDNCGNEYHAKTADIKRGWGKCCSKSCSAKKREKARPNYNIQTVERNNRIREGKMTDEDFASLPVHRQIYLNNKMFGEIAPSVFGSGRISGITSEGYRIMDGVAYDEFDEPVYNVDPYEDDYGHGQWND